MKYSIQLFSITVFSLLITTLCFSQDVTLNTQTDVDAFDPSTTTISGNLTITAVSSSNPITDLSNLSNLTSIDGHLWIYDNLSLQNLNGFQNLSSVGEYITMSNNALESMDFPNLNSIGGSLNIDDYNVNLQHLDGFQNLNSIGGDLQFIFNEFLEDINGFSNLISIGGKLGFDSNSSLQSINGFSNLTSIGGMLEIAYNPNLQNIDSLLNLTTIGMDLIIYSNSSITNIDGLSNLTSVNADLNLNNNAALVDCCGITTLLENPNGVIGSISIHSNPSECSNENEVRTTCGLPPVSVEEYDFASSLILHPNPTNENVYIDLGENYQTVDFKLRNILGQIIFQESVNSVNEFQFEINGAAGIYLLEIKTETEQTTTFKILKN